MSDREVELRARAWYGDVRRPIRFPGDWRVDVVGPDRLPPLSEGEIAARIQAPIASSRLREIARDHDSVAVLVDDLTRPTPARRVLPPVLAELREAGIPAERQVIVIAGGAHPPAGPGQVRRKIGDDLWRELRVEVHPGEDRLIECGTGPAGTPIRLHPAVAESDLVVGVGGIYPHGAAGFSGGVKIAVPGVCGPETARFLHQRVARRHRPGSEDGLEGPFRKEAEAIARRIGLEFIVNVVVNADRKPAGVFAGDPVEAHRRGARFMSEHYTVDDTETRSGADVIVADAYPFDVDLQFSHAKGLWPLLDAGAGGATRVGLATCPEGAGGHRLSPIDEGVVSKILRHLKRLGPAQIGRIPDRLRGLARMLRQRRMELLLLSDGVSTEELRSAFPRGRVMGRWSSLMTELRSRHPEAGVRVLVYRCAPLLFRASPSPAPGARTEPADLDR